MDDGKANLAPPADKSVWRKIIGVQIANGEWIGVAVEFKMPGVFEGITNKNAYDVQRMIGEAADKFSMKHSVQAKDWAGHAIGNVLNIDTTDKKGKARVGHILKTWISRDVLRIEREMDPQKGREVPVVVVGEWINPDDL
ncbi:hypothetical protein [Pseudogemmobacter sp. W21_MBD1_M6]|uniref:hypothetical protein n=1 Tax=Pseudogemmobacter sp. W21_MBD1_M6 TaxID=3240271 RepID=UPI003F97F9C8